MKKISAASFTILSIIMFLGAAGYFGINSMHKKVLALEELSGELDAVSNLNLTMHEAVSYLNNYLVTGDPDEKERFKKASEEVRKQFDDIAVIEGEAGRADASLENARRLYANIDRMADELFKYEVPLNSRDAVILTLEIQRTADWISRLYIEVHELKDREKLETVIKEAESARRLAGWVQITGTITALFIGLALVLKQ